MPDPKKRNETNSSKSHLTPHSCTKLSTTKVNHTNSSTQHSNPLSAQTDVEGSLDDLADVKDIEYEYIDGYYERAEEDAPEKLDAARSSLYWKNVWSRAVWRVVTPSPNPRVPGAKKLEKPILPTSQTSGRVLAAGVNTETVELAKSKRTRGQKVTGTKGSEDEKSLEYFSDADSESSHSSSSSYPAEVEDLQIIQNLEFEDFWTFIQAPDIEEDWDMIPEADRLRQLALRPTINTLLRERFEALRAEREALRAGREALEREMLERSAA
jgi:hypothetical protein